MKLLNLLKKASKKVNVVVMLNALAIIAVVQNVNAACFWLAYQPEVPDCAKRFMKES